MMDYQSVTRLTANRMAALQAPGLTRKGGVASAFPMTFDVAIIGAGIAGASLAAALPPALRVVLIEAEEFPGYHATGRSAAFWSETYGGPFIQPLTTASGPFLREPPASFSPRPFLSLRGALMIGTAHEEPEVDAFLREFAQSGVVLDYVAGKQLDRWLPDRRSYWDRAIWEPTNSDIDVAALHAAYLKAAKTNGAQVAVRSRVSAIRKIAGGWIVSAGDDHFECGRVVNASGAWADDIARLAGAQPTGIRPFRRTMVQLRVDAAVPAELPLIVDIGGNFYFKPEGRGRIWLSPHDETPSAACDAAPEEVDIAIAIDRFTKVMRWPVIAVERSWAGLRSFAPDRLPVFGEDPACAGFYWCAGQGGFGIQTAPAISALLAAAITGEEAAPPYQGIDPAFYAPGRAGLKS